MSEKQSNYEYLLKRYGLDEKEGGELTPAQEAEKQAIMGGSWIPTQEELDNMTLEQWTRYELLNGRDPSPSDLIKKGLEKARKAETNDPGVSAADLVDDPTGQKTLKKALHDDRPKQTGEPTLSETQRLIREGLKKNSPGQQTGEPG